MKLVTEKTKETVDLVCEYLKGQPSGATPKQIAEAIGTSNAVVRNALQRGYAKRKVRKLQRGYYALKGGRFQAVTPTTTHRMVERVVQQESSRNVQKTRNHDMEEAIRVLEAGVILLRRAIQ